MIALWAIVLLVIFVRAAWTPHRNTVLETYEKAGGNWLAAHDIYKTRRGFVYSPLIAALFAPFSLMPDLLSNVLWRLLNFATYIGALWWWLKLSLHRNIPRASYDILFLLLLPLSLGNFNNGQANPIITGLLMLAIIGARTERWNLAAFCIAVAVYFKIYPIVAGLLLALVFPRQFSWRMVVFLVALGVLSFLLQKPSYVWHQYELWFATRISDNRRLTAQNIAPNDLWLLLRCLQISITEKAYIALQVASGAAIAGICLFGKVKRWPLDRLLATLFTLVVCWILLLGPATESATYVLLAPAMALALVQAYHQPMSPWLRGMVTSAFVISLMALGINSFTSINKDLYAKALQPAGALIFSCYSLIWLLTPSYWLDNPGKIEPATTP